jgi:hypothetical protein
MILPRRRSRISSCFAPRMAVAISFLLVNESFSQLACAVLPFASACFSSAALRRHAASGASRSGLEFLF